MLQGMACTIISNCQNSNVQKQTPNGRVAAFVPAEHPESKRTFSIWLILLSCLPIAARKVQTGPKNQWKNPWFPLGLSDCFKKSSVLCTFVAELKMVNWKFLVWLSLNIWYNSHKWIIRYWKLKIDKRRQTWRRRMLKIWNIAAKMRFEKTNRFFG